MSEAMVTTAVQVANAESLTPTQIAQRVEAIHGELPRRIATLGMALKREGFTFRRNRFSLKKTQRSRVRHEAGHARQAPPSRSRGAVRLLFLDEAGFCCSPPLTGFLMADYLKSLRVQRSSSGDIRRPCAADRNRTRNPQLRRLVLYPIELPRHRERLLQQVRYFSDPL